MTVPRVHDRKRAGSLRGGGYFSVDADDTGNGFGLGHGREEVETIWALLDMRFDRGMCPQSQPIFKEGERRFLV